MQLWADVYATAAFARGRDATDWLAGRAPDHNILVVQREQDESPSTPRHHSPLRNPQEQHGTVEP